MTDGWKLWAGLFGLPLRRARLFFMGICCAAPDSYAIRRGMRWHFECGEEGGCAIFLSERPWMAGTAYGNSEGKWTLG